MSLKIGDKVKMTPRGFKFYADLDTAFRMHSCAGSMEHKDFTPAVCEQLAIHGVGTIQAFNKEGDPNVRWEFRTNGMRYHYSHYFDVKDIVKLTFFDKLCLKIRNFLC